MPEHECVWSSLNGQGKLCCPVCSTVAENQPFEQPETCRMCGGGKAIPLLDLDDEGQVIGSHPVGCPACKEAQPAPKHGAASQPDQERCTRCGGEMSPVDQQYNVGGVHPDRWKCADGLEARIRHLAELLRRAYALLLASKTPYDHWDELFSVANDITAALEGLVEVER